MQLENKNAVIYGAGDSLGAAIGRALADAGATVFLTARRGEVLRKMKADTMLKELPAMKDIANAVVFLASDMAAKITGVTLDITVGTTAALNYEEPAIAFVRKQ